MEKKWIQNPQEKLENKLSNNCPTKEKRISPISGLRVSVQGVKSLGGHFACLCQRFDLYEAKKNISTIIFRYEKRYTFTLLIIFIVKSLQKEQNSTNLLL